MVGVEGLVFAGRGLFAACDTVKLLNAEKLFFLYLCCPLLATEFTKRPRDDGILGFLLIEISLARAVSPGSGFYSTASTNAVDPLHNTG